MKLSSTICEVAYYKISAFCIMNKEKMDIYSRNVAYYLYFNVTICIYKYFPDVWICKKKWENAKIFCICFTRFKSLLEVTIKVFVVAYYKISEPVYNEWIKNV